MVLVSGKLSDNQVVASDQSGDSNRPDTPHEAYKRMKPRWEMCRALMIGTDAIREGAETYLPRMEEESDASYEFRRTLVALHNGFQRTVLASVGFILEEPPELGADMPKVLADFAENVDRAGTHLNVFTRRLSQAGVTDGFAGILVEHTKVKDPQKVSADDEKRLGIGPYWLLYKVDDVYKPVYEMVNGVRTLTLLILREVVKKRVGRFGYTTVTRYRVYTNDEGKGVVRCEVWEAVGQGVPIMTETAMVITNQTEIPWSPLPVGDEISPDEWKPPLMDLAFLNIEHHQCKTNMASLETLACVPTQVRIGAKPDENGEYPPIKLGPRSTIEAPYQQGVPTPLYWHSPSIDALEPTHKSLDKIEAAMGAAGMAFLSPDTRAAETAEARRIDTAAQRATLQSFAQAVQDCLERAFGFTANFIPSVTAGSVTVNNNFTGEGINTAFLTVCLQAYEKDSLTLEELRYVFQTGQLPEDFDAEDTALLLAAAAQREEEARLAQEALANKGKSGAPSKGTPPTPGAAGV